MFRGRKSFLGFKDPARSPLSDQRCGSQLSSHTSEFTKASRIQLPSVMELLQGHCAYTQDTVTFEEWIQG